MCGGFPKTYKTQGIFSGSDELYNKFQDPRKCRWANETTTKGKDAGLTTFAPEKLRSMHNTP